MVRPGDPAQHLFFTTSFHSEMERPTWEKREPEACRIPTQGQATSFLASRDPMAPGSFPPQMQAEPRNPTVTGPAGSASSESSTSSPPPMEVAMSRLIGPTTQHGCDMPVRRLLTHGHSRIDHSDPRFTDAPHWSHWRPACNTFDATPPSAAAALPESREQARQRRPPWPWKCWTPAFMPHLCPFLQRLAPPLQATDPRV